MEGEVPIVAPIGEDEANGSLEAGRRSGQVEQRLAGGDRLGESSGESADDRPRDPKSGHVDADDAPGATQLAVESGGIVVVLGSEEPFQGRVDVRGGRASPANLDMPRRHLELGGIGGEIEDPVRKALRPVADHAVSVGRSPTGVSAIRSTSP